MRTGSSLLLKNDETHELEIWNRGSSYALYVHTITRDFTNFKIIRAFRLNTINFGLPHNLAYHTIELKSCWNIKVEQT